MHICQHACMHAWSGAGFVTVDMHGHRVIGAPNAVNRQVLLSLCPSLSCWALCSSFCTTMRSSSLQSWVFSGIVSVSLVSSIPSRKNLRHWSGRLATIFHSSETRRKSSLIVRALLSHAYARAVRSCVCSRSNRIKLWQTLAVNISG